MKSNHMSQRSAGEGERRRNLNDCLGISMQESTGFRFNVIVFIVSLGGLSESRGKSHFFDSPCRS